MLPSDGDLNNEVTDNPHVSYRSHAFEPPIARLAWQERGQRQSSGMLGLEAFAAGPLGPEIPRHRAGLAEKLG